jgi:hypothetical protein
MCRWGVPFKFLRSEYGFLLDGDTNMIGVPLKVREFIGEIDRGEVLLPEIQRSYVWKGPQVAKLVDSLYREFPSGQILLWDTANLPVTKPMPGVEGKPEAATLHPKIVLDGQQRLTSLYKALKDSTDGLEVYFHLGAEQFQLYHSRLKSDPLWISLREVFHNKSDLKLLREIEAKLRAPLDQDTQDIYLDRLQRLRAIGDYKYPIEIFRTDDYEQVTELFIRINSGGTRLRGAELVLAQLALRLPGALVDTFEKTIDEYEDLGYELDARFLIRALIATGTGQSRFRYLTEFWKKDAQEIRKIWQNAKRGVDAAVNFVRLNAGFESSDWLPSLNALIPLAAYFEQQETIAGDVERGLLRWFYATALRGRYSGSAETAMDEDLKAVRSEDPISTLMRNAVQREDELEVRPDEFDDAGWRNPLFPLTYVVAKKRKAKDWFKGIALGRDVAGEDHQIEVHHIFPKALLREMGVPRRKIDEIANLAFLMARPNKQISNREPIEYLSDIAEKHPNRLTAQSVPIEPGVWHLDKFPEFLAARRKLLAEAVTELLLNPA